MHITIRHGSQIISKKTVDRIQAKLQRLSRIIDERNYEAQVHVDITKESGSKHSESMWRTGVNIDLAGDRYTASEVAATPEKAFDRAAHELKRGIRSTKVRQLEELKRSGSMFKTLQQQTG